MYDKALALAKDAHNGQVDKAGQPYINHLLAVANCVNDETEKIIALLHDIIEDTCYSLEDLKSLGFCDDVVEAVSCLTKREHEPYDTYLKRISSNRRAVHVKLSDLQHNMDLSRLATVTEKDLKRMEKYQYAVAFLCSTSIK
jgi:(p)ppGpp synthase/HD superfamily hydrolase